MNLYTAIVRMLLGLFIFKITRAWISYKAINNNKFKNPITIASLLLGGYILYVNGIYNIAKILKPYLISIV